ncbi:MAG: NADH-quinone oxidoreductase subunit N [Deltaproteobacteria bacterium]|nr:NADH-quinone oxidoreductase subunit N [Deltaproteobacteria bacterium]
MNFSLNLLGPELVFLLLALTLFLASMLEPQKPALARRLVGLCPVAALASAVWALAACPTGADMFFGGYRVDRLSQFFKILISLGFLATYLNARRQKTVTEDQKPDYFMFLSLSSFGLVVLASAAELAAIYLAMELSSYSLYVLIPARTRSKAAAEAGLKYILFGAAATALALYGLAFIIASQHHTQLGALAGLDWRLATNPLAVTGLTLFMGGLFFKLALFPFHFWCPDVYQGAGNETAAYVATLPKLGAIVVLIRLAQFLVPGEALTNLLAVLAAASVTYGNLCALAQKDLKRMLGFSSVAHAGYILVGLVAGTPEGLAAAAFYAMAYLLMNLLCFWIIARLSPDGRNLVYEDLNGLSTRSPSLALCLLASAFSLVSLPPTVGFIGKLWLITSAWGHGYDWLVIVVCVNSAIAIFYYLSLVRHAYAEETPGRTVETAVDLSFLSRAGALIMAILVLLLGVLPGPVWSLVLAASRSLWPAA